MTITLIYKLNLMSYLFLDFDTIQPYKPEHRKYRREVQKCGAVDGDLYMIVNGVVKVPYRRILIKKKCK